MAHYRMLPLVRKWHASRVLVTWTTCASTANADSFMWCVMRVLLQGYKRRIVFAHQLSHCSRSSTRKLLLVVGNESHRSPATVWCLSSIYRVETASPCWGRWKQAWVRGQAAGMRAGMRCTSRVRLLGACRRGCWCTTQRDINTRGA